ncbi:MAG: 4-hydroxy-tetrahydrodipicolinate reductase [Firmicutes bacterium]|nr:4-hydroxy-tetrahydrodipicolinate reductase [Bacillota bacterium]
MAELKEIKLILSGCFGKMGRSVIEEVKNFESIKIIGGIDKHRKNESNFEIFPIFNKATEINVNCDVLLDFSSPSALKNILNFSISKKLPIVICTTGYSNAQIDDIKNASKFCPIFLAENTSLAINLIKNLSKHIKNVLGKEFDIEIIEKHHSQKLDAPSGTALMIANAVSEKNTKYNYDRSQSGRRDRNEIGIHSIRGGTIKGEHEIIFAGKNETITLKHSAGSRSVFANGALNAVLFIKNKLPGMYCMDDLEKDKN